MILVYGTVCLDRIRSIDSLPRPGGYSEINSEFELLGGEAANTASHLRKWGASFSLQSNPLGCDAEGELLRGKLAESLIPYKELGSPIDVTPYCDVYITPDGERTMFGRGFREMAKTTDLNQIAFEHHEWFSADSNHGPAAYSTTLKAHQAGLQLYLLDFVDPEAPVPAGCFWQSSTDWIGFRNNTQKNLEWVRAWSQEHQCHSILSDGPNGFCYSSPDGEADALPPFPCPQVVDSTGAGDTFRAGMLYGLSKNWTIDECLKMASAAGCLNCLGIGGHGGLFTEDEIRAFIDKNSTVARRYSHH
ncbi:MAG: carbohydrate kinase family protein [Armatimonadetes bacterium]|nr:carbohydrate kinase family protein [Armatimonadota bacterium]